MEDEIINAAITYGQVRIFRYLISAVVVSSMAEDEAVGVAGEVLSFKGCEKVRESGGAVVC